MPLINFLLNEEENNKLKKFSNKWKLNKPETIKKIIKDFTEVENGNN